MQQSHLTDRKLSNVQATAPAADLKLSALHSLVEQAHDLDNELRGSEIDASSDGPATSSHLSNVPRHRSDAHDDFLVQARLGLASSLFTALRAKDAPTAQHSLRVAIACSAWAFTTKLTKAERDEIEIAALLHDVGKIGVPDSILQKSTKLSSEDTTILKHHQNTGREVLLACGVSKEIEEIVIYSPAWYDGSRYAYDRSGDDLPIGARMLAIADAFDAMTTDQVYRRAHSRERALAELFKFSGTQFDPQLVEQFYALDHINLHRDVAERWLGHLDPNAINLRWSFGKTSMNGVDNTPESLFNSQLFDHIHNGVAFVDTDLRVLRWNQSAERLTGIPASSIYHKTWLPRLVHLCEEQKEPIQDSDCPVAEALHTGMHILRRMSLTGRNQQRMSVNLQVIPVFDVNGCLHGATIVFDDVTSEEYLQERIETLHHKATRDALTKVYNRAEFDRVHGEFVDDHLKRHQPCSLIICDLDHFKKVNDTFGHQIGDEILVSFGALLQRSCRRGDLVARYGGEEFVMLCADCDLATVAGRAEQIRCELASTKHPSLKGKAITSSFGITEIQMGDTPKTMLRRADRAVYKAKEAGRNAVVQVGCGLSGEEPKPHETWWSTWMQRSRPGLLLEKNLVSRVPLNVAVDKIRGLVADHKATILSVKDNQVVIAFDNSVSTRNRTGDRNIPLLTEITFHEENSSTAADGVGDLHMRVTIRPRKKRNRRHGETLEGARQLFASLQSYLIASNANLRPTSATDQSD